MFDTMSQYFGYIDPALSVRELEARWGSSAPYPHIRHGGIFRNFPTYGKQNKWSTFTVDRHYVVFVEDKTHVMGGAGGKVRMLGGAVLKFTRYKKVTDQEWGKRKAVHVIALGNYKRARVEYLKDIEDGLVAEDDDFDEPELEHHDDMIATARAAKEMTRYIPVFTDRYGVQHEIDLFGRGETCAQVVQVGHATFTVTVGDVQSKGWTVSPCYAEGFAVETRLAIRSMSRIRMETAWRDLQDAAALRIQRGWRKATSDPAYKLCRRRLKREFSTLVSEDGM